MSYGLNQIMIKEGENELDEKKYNEVRAFLGFRKKVVSKEYIVSKKDVKRKEIDIKEVSKEEKSIFSKKKDKK